MGLKDGFGSFAGGVVPGLAEPAVPVGPVRGGAGAATKRDPGDHVTQFDAGEQAHATVRCEGQACGLHGLERADAAAFSFLERAGFPGLCVARDPAGSSGGKPGTGVCELAGEDR